MGIGIDINPDVFIDREDYHKSRRFYNGIIPPNGPVIVTELTLESSHEFLPFTDSGILEEKFLEDVEEMIDDILDLDFLQLQKRNYKFDVGRLMSIMNKNT